ncbi:hypothetical protein [Cedecea neteri]|uniref:Bacteriophage protein n=2 Tax=Cedecea neteri TaxID=158822 RepID=A0A291DUD8_9ENTR|nr:hypothetical protein [Cedecea neteri]ATF91430.1 hypothetical protein CO704_04725 [Cedecea neteri]
MKYRRESSDGDYTFGQGENTFLENSPECVAQAVSTRLKLWQGEWFLDNRTGTPYRQSVLGKQQDDSWVLMLIDRVSQTMGVKSVLDVTAARTEARTVTFHATIDTVYGPTTLNSEA